MEQILLLLLFNSLYIFGFYLCFDEDMIFYSLNKYQNKLGKLWKPIAGCVTCMASLHSWPYFIYNDFNIIYIIYIFALAGVNTFIYNVTFRSNT